MPKKSYEQKRMEKALKELREGRRQAALDEMYRTGEIKLLSRSVIKKRLKFAESGTDYWRTIF